MSQYHNTKLDVVSLAEVRMIVDEAKPTEGVGKGLLGQIKAVLDHVEDQMQYVSHERRSQISLGEFMAKHHYLNASMFSNYSSDLLRNQIQSALGQKETIEESAAAVDWELGGVRTHPGSRDASGLDEHAFDVHENDEKSSGTYDT